MHQTWFSDHEETYTDMTFLFSNQRWGSWRKLWTHPLTSCLTLMVRVWIVLFFNWLICKGLFTLCIVHSFKVYLLTQEQFVCPVRKYYLRRDLSNFFLFYSTEVIDAHLQNNQTTVDNSLASPDRLKGIVTSVKFHQVCFFLD